MSDGCPLLRGSDWQTWVSRELRSSDLVGRVRAGESLRFRLSTRLAPTNDNPEPVVISIEQVGA